MIEHDLTRKCFMFHRHLVFISFFPHIFVGVLDMVIGDYKFRLCPAVYRRVLAVCPGIWPCILPGDAGAGAENKKTQRKNDGRMTCG